MKMVSSTTLVLSDPGSLLLVLQEHPLRAVCLQEQQDIVKMPQKEG